MLSKISPVPLVLSGYCPYLPSIHPGSPLRNALTILSARPLSKLDVWSDLFDLHFVTLQFREARITHARLTGRWGLC